MLFKISLSNIRKSLKDYAIYFFTLVLGVAVFYVFNAIETQTSFLKVNEDQREMIKVLTTSISAVSVFIAVVLGLLIVYASRFLMKRRNKEFALYMMLGMSKWRISALLLCETVIIGIGSLFVGLLIGVGLSQVMSAVVANLFEADMNAYKFTVSGSAITKTIIYFGIMYAVVMLRSGFVISKCRLITLMNSGRLREDNHEEPLGMRDSIPYLRSSSWLGILLGRLERRTPQFKKVRLGYYCRLCCYILYILVSSRNAPESYDVRKGYLSSRSQQLHIPSAQQQGKHHSCFHDSYLPHAFRYYLYSFHCIYYQKFHESGC